MELVCKKLMANDDEILGVLKTNCFLIMAISLGLQIDIHDLYAPNNKCVVTPIFLMELTHRMTVVHYRQQPTFSANGC